MNITLYSITITLILVMDPLGNIPLYLAILRYVDPHRRRYIILREACIAFAILTLFLFFGQYILDGMHISQPALEISGGIILFLIAIRMIFPHEDAHERPKHNSDPFIVPLAIPLFAGPSAMTVVILLANQAPDNLKLAFVALFVAWFISTLILVFSESLRKLLGEKGLTAIERLMGMILTTMAVQMFLSGFGNFLQR